MDLALDARPRAGETVPGACARCGHEGLRRARITSVFRRGTGLVAIEDVPALVCPACGEEHLDDETATRLDVLRGQALAFERAEGTILVPVFRFPGDARGAE